MKRYLLFFLMAASLAANLGLGLILFTPLPQIMAMPLISEDAPVKSEAIAVLAFVDAYDTEDGGFLDFATLARMQRALELYRAGYAPKLICVGGNRLASGKSVGTLMRETFELYGVSVSDILVQDAIPGNFEYYDNLIGTVSAFPAIDFNKVMVVTSCQNTYRIRKSFEKRGFTPTMISAPKYALTPSNWHINFETFRDVFNEWAALALFKYLGRI